jgi:DNA-binding NarL/FixJ family response regulator
MADEIRIVIADDHPVLRMGLKQVMGEDPRLRVVGEADDGEEALERITAEQPDVAVLDIEMPKLDGFAVLRRLREARAATSVIFLTFHADEDLLDEAISLGAKGYVLKENAPATIVEAVIVVAAGHHYVTSSLSDYLLRRRARTRELEEQRPELASLTLTERRILQQVAGGETSKEIAKTLCVHYRTVENYRLNIAQKLGLKGHNAVLKFALRHRNQL